MKKKLTRALALILMLCMLLPQSALAYTTYYVEVKISDEDGKSVSGQSSHWATRSEPLAAAVVGVVVDKYEELERVFAKTGLRGIVDGGIEAFRGGDEAWREYVETYYEEADGAFKDILMDKSSTYADLTVDRVNRLTYRDEENNMGYTVTVTLRAYSSGGSDEDNTHQSGEKDHEVTVKPVDPPLQPGQPQQPSEKGSLETSHKRADANDVVTITVKPGEGWVVNQVTVVDRNGAPVSVTAVNNETYRFVMPAGNVEVSSTFSVKPRSTAETGVDRMLKSEKIAYIRGKDDGNFHPSAPITRAEVAMIFYRLLKNTDVAATPVFDDVNRGAWYTEAIDTLAAIGIVNGMTENTFAPDDPITRAQFAAICVRFAAVRAEGKRFADISEDHWAAEYISTGAAFGWINGISETEFAPDRPITRAEATAMVNRMLARIPDRGYIDAQPRASHPDVYKSSWAWYDINEASLGLVVR